MYLLILLLQHLSFQSSISTTRAVLVKTFLLRKGQRKDRTSIHVVGVELEIAYILLQDSAEPEFFLRKILKKK